MSKKRIVFVGAGALGGHVAGHMARIGLDITVIDGWPDHVNYINEHGIELSGLTPEERHTVPLRALHITDVQTLAKEKPVDIAVIATKSYDTEWATLLIAPYLAEGGYVVSLQNCINEERVARHVGWGRTVGCIAALIGVELTKPGHIQRNVGKGDVNNIVFRVGEPHGRITPRVQEFAQMCESADSAKVTTNLWGERWSKLATNGMRNGLSACTGLSGNERDTIDVTRRFGIKLAGEAVRIGLAQGYALEKINGMEPADWMHASEGEPEALKRAEAALDRASANRGDDQRPSMAQDIRKGRRTEIDFLNGFIVEQGHAVGIDAPSHRIITDLVRQVERNEIEPDIEHIRRLPNR